jgi:hypothetical protein
MPVAQTLYPAGPAQLDETGGYQCCRANDHRVEGVVAFASGYSQVSGGEIQKPSGGWSTISTTVIEGLNILEVVTADRIVGQIITEHPAEGYVPRISFLGTRFENLRIAGHPVHLELALDILGEEAPADDGSYTQDRGVISRISSQYKAARGKKPPSELAGQFDELKSTIGNRDAIEGSLISQLETSFPGQFFNHVIRIRDFGTITLAKLRVEHEDFHPKKGSPKKTTVKLTMIECKLGCAIAGAMDLAEPSNNGTTQP